VGDGSAPEHHRRGLHDLLAAQPHLVPLSLLLHATTRASWIEAAAAGTYTAGLEAEGFIHCSTAGQLERVARAFPVMEGLVLLCVDEARLEAEVRWEGTIDDGPRFPHVYGAINLDAVVDVVALPPGRDGRYALPSEVALLDLRYR
jgi:uncharacterized protein (DUF952 family)